jgi:hypothetical protein
MRIKSKTTFNFEGDPQTVFVEGLTFKEVLRYAYHLLHFYSNFKCVVASDGQGGFVEIIQNS